MLAVLLGTAGFAMPVYADSAVTVANDDAFEAALRDGSVTSITLAYTPAAVRSGVTVSRPLTIVGSGGEMISDGGAITVTAEGKLDISGLKLRSDNDYIIKSGGAVTLKDGMSISGVYGIELSGGGSLTSGGAAVKVDDSVKNAVAVTSGSASVSNINLSGGQNLIYVSQNASALNLSGAVTISNNNGNAIICSTGGSASTVAIADGANITLNAPNAYTADGYHGAAIENYNGKITVGNLAIVNATGSMTAIRAADVVVGNSASITAACTREAGIGSSSAAITGTRSVAFGDNTSINIGTSGSAVGNGIYGGSVTFGSGCRFVMYGGGKDAYALKSGSTAVFGNTASFQSKNVPNGIMTSKTLTFGEGCVVEITGAKQYGIKATGTMIADRVRFEKNCIVNISADYCSLYTNEALEIMHNSEMNIESGSKAPAVWIDTDKNAQGHLIISGARVSIKSKVNSSSVLNSGVYVVGAITIDNGAAVTSICEGDFGMISLNGDINIGSGAKLYTSGGCGIYLNNGNLRLSDSGALYAEGLLDSGIRIKQGVLNIGDKSTIDTQGVRFGAELLGSGGVWINGAASFDFRSTADRAIFIENGSFNINGAERISAWKRVGTGSNTAAWWSADTTGMRSWEISANLTEDKKLYADKTKLAPSGAQTFRAGTGGEAPDLAWIDGTEFELAEYSRIAISKTRPTARSNSFNIPAGKTFSWWLYGESYYGAVSGFKASGSSGGGEFTLADNGKFTYKAPSSLRGEQSFNFVVVDKDGLESEMATVKILVTASKPPISYSMSFETPMNTKLSSTLSVRDYDGSIADITLVTEPQHGKIIVGSDGSFSYTPNDFYCGIDTFSYYATDNKGDTSPTAHVSIIIGMEKEAIAYNGTLLSERDSSVTGALTARAEVNEYAETEEEKPYITKIVVTKEPEYGTIVFDDLTTVTYTPYGDFAGTDSFTYKALCSDGQETNEATVSLITVPNQKPTASSMLMSCLDGYRCSAKLVYDDLDGEIADMSVVSQPQHGKVELDKNTGEFKYIPDNGFTGKDFFTYCVTDDEGFVSKEATVVIEVRGFFAHMQAIGKLGLLILIAAVVIAASVVLTIVIVKNAKKAKKRREEEELQAERDRIQQMIDYGDLQGVPNHIMNMYRRNGR